MGSCLSKRNGSCALNASAPISLAAAKPETTVHPDHKKPVENEVKVKNKVFHEEVTNQLDDESLVKKEIFVIKHRKSHDREKRTPVADVERERVASASTSVSEKGNQGNGNNVADNGNSAVPRTSSCTKEELDAILIQCGRLSRSNSSGGVKVAASGRKYSGSKRSYDFDHNEQENQNPDSGSAAEYEHGKDDRDDGAAAGETRRDRQRHRLSSSQRSSSSASQGRRRTPSREREQRSGSRERGSSGSSGRRVSRSPGRRSESTTNTCANVNRPAKMVSVPATVSSMEMDKSNNGIAPQTTAIKRISVKRSVSEAAGVGSRSAASPRSVSPARANVKSTNENHQQQPSLSRNSSRKAEQSPYRRNPLGEIDPNSLVYPQAVGNKATSLNTNNVNGCNKVQVRNKEMEGLPVAKESIYVQNQGLVQKPNAETNNRVIAKGSNCKGNSNKKPNVSLQQSLEAAAVSTVVPPGDESLKPQALTRSRSARQSRDLDLNPEALLNHSPSYTTLLLEDIQNFHQKNVPAFSLPPCLTKACSILEAVADLNSTTSSNQSCPVLEDRRSAPMVGANLVGKKLSEAKDPFVESEIQASDDLVEPSFHKYVTIRRGGTLLYVEDTDGQESSGSNSFVGESQQQLGYSTSPWEPNSADSTDRWTSRSNITREETEKKPMGFQRDALPESGRDFEENRREFSGQRTGIGRGRAGVGKSLHSSPVVAATTSTSDR